MVRAVQVALYCYGFNPGKTDAIFGDNTKLAVLQFQRAKGLTADGIAGKNTIKALMGI
jgi:peptidoglycan hydrolase-like protein with peptidoglycan-binding domain